jgi:ApaG protein
MTDILKLNKSSEELLNPLVITNRPYIAITNGIQVAVWSEFIDSKISGIGDLFVWVYHIRIDNKSEHVLKLINRYWRIVDEKGIIQEINGDGVIGEQPVIEPNKFYQYSSGVHLRYPSGIMSGKYKMKKISDDSIIDITIPSFSLDVPTVKHVIN